MARYTGATWRPLPQNATQLHIKPVGVVLHTAVSDGKSLYNFFDGKSAGVESHFYVAEDGAVEQYMDTEVRADCQLDGNSWLSGGARYGFISIETWDGGHPATTPWNDKQLAALEALIAWLCKTHDFPAVKATGPRGQGIGWHAQFTTSSSSSALSWNHSHSCPDARRIAQIPALIESVSGALKGAPVTPKEDIDLTPAQAKQLADIHAAVTGIGSLIQPKPDAPLEEREKHSIGFYGACGEKRVWDLANDEEARFERLLASLQGLYAKVDALAARLDAIQEGEK